METEISIGSLGELSNSLKEAYYRNSKVSRVKLRIEDDDLRRVYNNRRITASKIRAAYITSILIIDVFLQVIVELLAPERTGTSARFEGLHLALMLAVPVMNMSIFIGGVYFFFFRRHSMIVILSSLMLLLVRNISAIFLFSEFTAVSMICTTLILCVAVQLHYRTTAAIIAVMFAAQVTNAAEAILSGTAGTSDTVPYLACSVCFYSTVLFIAFLSEVFTKRASVRNGIDEGLARVTANILKATIPFNVGRKLLATGKYSEVLDDSTVAFMHLRIEDTRVHMKKVIVVLQAVFDMMDRLCLAAGYEKVKTFGSTFMAFGPSAHQAGAAATFLTNAATCLHAVQDALPDEYKPLVSFQGGVAQGPVATNVIGHRMARFDLWGDVVNLAARLTYSAETGTVACSNLFAQTLVDHVDFSLTSCGKIRLKGKGEQAVYRISTSHPSVPPEVLRRTLAQLKSSLGVPDDQLDLNTLDTVELLKPRYRQISGQADSDSSFPTYTDSDTIDSGGSYFSDFEGGRISPLAKLRSSDSGGSNTAVTSEVELHFQGVSDAQDTDEDLDLSPTDAADMHMSLEGAPALTDMTDLEVQAVGSGSINIGVKTLFAAATSGNIDPDDEEEEGRPDTPQPLTDYQAVSDIGTDSDTDFDQGEQWDHLSAVSEDAELGRVRQEPDQTELLFKDITRHRLLGWSSSVTITPGRLIQWVVGGVSPYMHSDQLTQFVRTDIISRGTSIVVSCILVLVIQIVEALVALDISYSGRDVIEDIPGLGDVMVRVLLVTFSASQLCVVVLIAHAFLLVHRVRSSPGAAPTSSDVVFHVTVLALNFAMLIVPAVLWSVAGHHAPILMFTAAITLAYTSGLFSPECAASFSTMISVCIMAGILCLEVIGYLRAGFVPLSCVIVSIYTTTVFAFNTIVNRGANYRVYVYGLESQQRKSQVEHLIFNVFPRHVAKRLFTPEDTAVSRFRSRSMSMPSDRSVSSETALYDRSDWATILQLDMCSFTEFSATRTPMEVTDVLSDLFSIFDRCASEHSLSLVKNIGDAAVYVAGLRDANTDHAVSCVDAAIGMIQECESYTTANNMRIKIRIGIGTGAVYGSVFGAHRFNYDILGPAADEANTMEQSGLPMRVHLTDRTAKLIGTRYRLQRDANHKDCFFIAA